MRDVASTMSASAVGWGCSKGTYKAITVSTHLQVCKHSGCMQLCCTMNNHIIGGRLVTCFVG